jgi:soluble lytic murein transglycosylase-like protein
MVRRATLIGLAVAAVLGLSQLWAGIAPSPGPGSDAADSAIERDTALSQSEDPDERAALAFLRGRHTGLSRFEEEDVARAVVREARRNELDPALVLAVIQVESGGYYLAASQVGALGLMQLLPTTAEELAGKLDLDWRGPDSLFDPVLNVTLGIAYIKELANRYGDVSTALAAYNWGPGRIDRRIRKGSGVPKIYRDRVMKAFDVALTRRATRPTSG